MNTNQNPTPVTILTGFLGSGKTTTLNRILKGEHGLKIGVLVNDFGSINIDADLVVGVENDGDIISLSNGCVCCNVRDDLINAIEEVISRPEAPEHIILEASGVAEPASLAMTFIDPNFRDRIRLDSILCVVDVEQVMNDPAMAELKLRQMACADMIVLNKVDLVDRAHIDKVKSWLDEYFHRIRVFETSYGEVPMEILLASGRFHPTQLDQDQDLAHNDHSTLFSKAMFTCEEPMRLEKLEETLKRLPVDIFRCKGIVYAPGEQGDRAVVQVVGKRSEISYEGKWDNGKPKTRLVAIGASGVVSNELMEKVFSPCVLSYTIDDKYMKLIVK